ncbi:MAG: cysteine hydrolase family protein [Bacilli bacterium]
MKALIVVDFTNDFVATDGKLTCGIAAQQIDHRIAELVETFVERGEYVVFATDIHYDGDVYHPEAKLFPPHNIAETDGRTLYNEVNVAYQKVKHANNVYWMDKTRYSAFCGTDLAVKLQERNINEVHLVGVCTDICVLHTAVDAYNKGYKIVIHKDAVASFNPTGHEWALSHFEGTLGAVVVAK